MKIFHLILKEIVHRKLNFFLSMLAVVTAVMFLVSFFTTGEASKRETIRLMRDMGYNLRIVHKDTDMDSFWTDGYSNLTMPQEYVYRFADQKNLSYNHLLATLKSKISWRGKPAVLIGITSEVVPPDMRKSSMIFTVKPGTIYVGFQLAQSLGIQKGDEVELLGKKFSVVNTLPETGSKEDIWIYGHLGDVQSLLGKEGRINEIKALACLCTIPDVDALVVLRKQLPTVLPDTKVFQITAIARARTEQRQMIDNYFALIMPFVVVVCAIWIGALAMLNARERQAEIGILRALGYGTFKISALFLGKSVFIGFIGAVLGFALGTILALQFGPDIFKVTAHKIVPVYQLLGWSLIAAPAFVALSGFIPAMIAATLDPAETLREE